MGSTACAAAGPFTDVRIRRLLEALCDEVDGARLRRVVASGEHSNDLAELHFDDGRALMVKRARFRWAAARFAASHVAAELLRRNANVVAPRPLPLPAGVDDRPVEAYWRIPLPTLRELWPGIPPVERPGVLRSLGRLIRRVHRIELRGHGPLAGAAAAGLADAASDTASHRAALAAAVPDPAALAEHLRADLEDRLLPAVIAEWPDGEGVVRRLLRVVPRVAACAGRRPPTLVHNDVHMGNVLCEVDGREVRCVGLLDLEAAVAGPPEGDLAQTELLHGPLFAQPIAGPWLRHLLDGYGGRADARALAFFRVNHLVNMGFHAALVGHHAHAAEIARAAATAADSVEAALG